MSLEAPSRPSEEDVMSDLARLGAEYVCLMPYAYMRSGDAEVKPAQIGQHWSGETEEGIRMMSQDAKSKGLSVMIKPHLWIGHGDYTGTLSFDSEQDQNLWNESYKSYVLRYARLAEEENAEILCIGTELCSQVQENPTFWKGLIAEIRSTYNGQLTYAANWDCYSDFPLWTELDYIGIDAYFPLASSDELDENTITTAWDLWKPGMKALSDSVSQPVLFTEYGYRSCEGALEEPWHNRNEALSNDSVQVTGFKALYTAIWSEPWFAGGFLWKWHCKEHLEWGDRSSDFTPQGKPALEVIRSNYRGQSLMNVE